MEWQTIDSVPRDCTNVLLYQKWDNGENYKGECISAGWFDKNHIGVYFLSGNFDGSPYGEDACYVTHWMPLPESPKL